MNHWWKLIAAVLVLWIYNGLPATEASCACGAAWVQTAQCHCPGQYCSCEERPKDMTLGERQACALLTHDSLRFARQEFERSPLPLRVTYLEDTRRQSAQPRAPPVTS